ncbi:Phytoene dehydrogenase-related protein [Sphingobium faniae]|nr:Phytoene dehydrogenase-related protein [Sphingobium faniae]
MTSNIIVVGAGSNSLSTACYLAKAGMSVLALERNAEPGGGVVSVEIAPGFVQDTHAMGFMTCLANPIIRHDELELASRFGLRWAYTKAPFASIFDDGTGLISHKDVGQTIESIRAFSEKDARAYAQLVEEAFELLPVLTTAFYAPPMPHSGFLKLLQSSEKGRGIEAAMNGSVLQFLEARFESPHVKIHFSKWAGEMMTAPDMPGTGLALYLLLGLSHSFEMGTVVGGSRNLTRALQSCFEHHGGTLQTGRTVQRLVVESGRCVGVELDDGEILRANKGVVANIHPWDLGTMVSGVPQPVVDRARAVKLSEYGALNQQIALAEAPKFKLGPQYSEPTMVECLSADWNSFIEPFKAYRRNQMPLDHLGPLVNTQSNIDPSRAPPGKAAVYLYNFAPFDIEGGWDARKQEVGDAVFDWFASFTSNVDRSKIIARLIESPADHDRHSRIMRKGDIMGIAMTADQLLGARPTPDLAQYAVPGVQGLYLAGCTSHPGGTVTLGGRATAMKMYDDMGIPLSTGFTHW